MSEPARGKRRQPVDEVINEQLVGGGSERLRHDRLNQSSPFEIAGSDSRAARHSWLERCRRESVTRATGLSERSERLLT